MSDIGKECKIPVNTSYDCQVAANFFPKAAYTILQGGGNNLPCGCISDKVTQGRHYIYWNPSGTVVSQDPNVQQVCLDPNDLPRGIQNIWINFEKT